jgi:Tfp pilus assembly protein PilF
MISNPSSSDVSSARAKVALQFASAALCSGGRPKAQMRLRDRLMEDAMDANAMTVLAHVAVEDRQIEDATVLLRRAQAKAEPKELVRG